MFSDGAGFPPESIVNPFEPQIIVCPGIRGKPQNVTATPTLRIPRVVPQLSFSQRRTPVAVPHGALRFR